jgi:hypothetical protein
MILRIPANVFRANVNPVIAWPPRASAAARPVPSFPLLAAFKTELMESEIAKWASCGVSFTASHFRRTPDSSNEAKQLSSRRPFHKRT